MYVYLKEGKETGLVLGVKVLLDVGSKLFLSDCTCLWNGMETSRYGSEVGNRKTLQSQVTSIGTDLR